jgi:hypothetical protein
MEYFVLSRGRGDKSLKYFKTMDNLLRFKMVGPGSAPPAFAKGLG